MTTSQVITGRVRFVFLLISLFALGLVYRLYTLQIMNNEVFTEKADRQYFSPNSALLDRGTIFFTSKEHERVTAAYQKIGNLVFINPKTTSEPERVYDAINAVVPIDRADFFAKANKKDDPYEEIIKRADAQVGEKIAESTKEFPSVQIAKQKWRTYPFDSLAAQVVGFMAFNDDELAGRYGLERQYEQVLKRSNESAYTNFFVEVFANLKGVIEHESGEGDIVTTIEPTVQAFLEQTLSKVNSTWKSEYSGGIIMDPATGDILAMGLAPTFDPNMFGDVENTALYTNRLVEDVYEMGSIVKPLTVAAGIDAGVITPTTTYYDNGFLVLNNRKISNYDGKGRGNTDMQQVLSQSLNTGVAYIAGKLGNAKFSEYMKSFGLDKKTGIDLPLEAAPLVDNLMSPREIEIATASYGQGIAISPIAITRALAVLANGGKLVSPHVVSAIDYKSGLSSVVEPSAPVQVLKPETTEKVTRMLVNVVDEALLHGTVKLDHYSVAAKTGTAQISDGRGYYTDRYLHSFFGYFPAYSPKFIVFLFTYYPKDVQYASETLTYSFHELTKYLIHYYDIPPDR
jgi:cell division protein FtsI/penicillin-binding protein 2